MALLAFSRALFPRSPTAWAELQERRVLWRRNILIGERLANFVRVGGRSNLDFGPRGHDRFRGLGHHEILLALGAADQFLDQRIAQIQDSGAGRTVEPHECLRWQYKKQKEVRGQRPEVSK